MKKTPIFLLFAVLALSGCRKPVGNYEHPDFEPVPTLNAVLSESRPVWVQVSMAQGLESVHPAVCKDAEVLLFVDGQFAENLRFDAESGFYQGETTAQAGCKYACKVVLPGYDTLFAQTTVPEKPVVTRVEIMENATVDEEGGTCPAVLLTFKTNPNQRLYYDANIEAFFQTHYVQNGDTTGHSVVHGSMNESINTDDPVLLNEGSDRLLFSNEIIRDTTYTLKVNTSFSSHSYGGQHSGSILVRSGYVVVNMHGLSESCFRYLKSQGSFEEPDGNTNLFLGVITPLNPYGNVKNGCGLFAAIAPMSCDTLFINPQ